MTNLSKIAHPVVGTPAPDFSLPRTGGGEIRLSTLRPGKAVLYFYPKDNTPGCTLEALDFTRLAGDFARAGTTVIGISRDSLASHERFCQKHALGIVLASDESNSVCEEYGTWAEKKNFGRSYMGILRTTFLIDGDGRIARFWPGVRVKGHAEEVLAAAQAL